MAGEQPVKKPQPTRIGELGHLKTPEQRQQEQQQAQASAPQEEGATKPKDRRMSIAPSSQQEARWKKAMAKAKAELGLEVSFNAFALCALDEYAERVIAGETLPPVTTKRKVGK
jgi:hypothetical protein